MHLQREVAFPPLGAMFSESSPNFEHNLYSRARLLVSGCARERRVLSREHQTECTSLSVVPYALRAKNMLHLPWVRCARAAATAAPFSPIQHLTFVGELRSALLAGRPLLSILGDKLFL
jgi:hypothetical protein